MQNIHPERHQDAVRLLDLLAVLGRKSSLRDPIASAVEAMGLTPPQLHSVLWVGRDGRLSMGELAQRIGVTEKTITGVVDRLEREGYVQRVREEGDRRMIKVELTERGREVFGQLDAEIHAKVAALLALLEVEDRAALFRIVERMTTRLGRGGGEA